jgi:hypothetical protein
MSSLEVMYIFASFATGFFWAIICLWLNILHDRSMTLLKDKPAPPKYKHVIYFCIGGIALAGSLLLYGTFSKVIPSPTREIGGAILLITWPVVLTILALRFRRTLKEKGLLK